jgi:hypothetical protein
VFDSGVSSLVGRRSLCASGDCVIADYVLWCSDCVSLPFCSLLISYAPFLSLFHVLLFKCY